jgi:hypothetical protein
MPDRQSEVQPPAWRRPVEAILDELELNTVEVLGYLTEVLRVTTHADATGAAWIRRQLELLAQVSVVCDGGNSLGATTSD